MFKATLAACSMALVRPSSERGGMHQRLPGNLRLVHTGAIYFGSRCHQHVTSRLDFYRAQTSMGIGTLT